MKLVDILGGYKLPVSNEEHKILEALNESPIMFEDLNDRNKQVVYDLYFKNVVNITDEGKITKNGAQALADVDWN